MSILIKGMEMPDCCTRCDYLGLNVAIGCPVMTGVNGRATDCPLIELSPHGRLIDADALLADVRAHSDSYFADDFAHEWVDVAPTVIPADEDGENG